MRIVFLLLCFWALPSANLAAETAPVITPTAPMLNSPPTNPDWLYQQLLTMQSQLARLDEKLQQQTAIGKDVTALETTQQDLKIQLANLLTKLEAQEKQQTNQLNGFDERLADMKDSFNWWLFTLTVLLAFGGYIVYQLSKKEAEDVASAQMKKYINEHSAEILDGAKAALDEKITELNPSINELKEYLTEARQIIEDKRKEVERAADDVQKSITEMQEPNPESLKILENNTKKISQDHATANEYLNFAQVSYGKKNYAEALKYLELALHALSDNEKLTRLHAQLLWNKAVTYSRLPDIDAKSKAYDELINTFENVQNEDIQELVARAMLNQGVTYGQQGNPEAAINNYSAVITQFKDAQNEDIQTSVAQAMLNQGVTYGQQGDPEAELNSYSAVITQFKDAQNEEIQVLVAQAMFNQGVTHGQQGNPEAELNSYSAMIAQFKDAQNEEIQVLVAQAMFNQGMTYGQQGDPEAELNSYSAMIAQFKDAKNEEIQVLVARAMFNQGVTYGQQGDPEAELNSYSAVITQFKDAQNEEVQVKVAMSMVNQGGTYGQQGDLEAALSSFSAVIAKFKDSQNEEIMVQVSSALANSAELAMLVETPKQVLARVAEAEAYTSDPQHFAVMQFLRFLLADKSIDDVLNAIAAIPKETELTWQFAEIKNYLDTDFTGEKQQQVQALVDFFEQHNDLEQLRLQLELAQQATGS
ncbi:tetratricopeptide repeat protein [Motilimonas sp. KMU-193]|uniref:tetratricopeptide repeat protein n=1 Tax=Motilimonas sp. KMU-193 TaxID=3388668 RepID=UPI00396B1DAB